MQTSTSLHRNPPPTAVQRVPQSLNQSNQTLLSLNSKLKEKVYTLKKKVSKKRDQREALTSFL